MRPSEQGPGFRRRHLARFHGAFALRDVVKRVLDDEAEVIVCGASRTVIRSRLKTIERDVLRRIRFVRTFDAASRGVTRASI
ncbi:MAG: hypothetical protein Q8L23_09845 [Caulobacter sp.]|nr:hypothetical protein [Caulobacter sp.]